MSAANDRIAFDLMTIYCIIEHLLKENKDTTLDDIASVGAKVVLQSNPFIERIKSYDGRYPVCDDVAKISKLYSDFFERKKKSIARFDTSTLQGFLSSLIQEYALEGKPYSKSLRSTQRSLIGYMDGKDIPLKDLTGKVVSDYKSYLYDRVTLETA